MDEYVGYADGSGYTNSDFWNDYYWNQQNDYGDDRSENGAWGDYPDDYADDYTNDASASA